MSEEKVEDALSTEARKRPTGLTIIAILWFLGGIYNLYMSSQGINVDLEALPYLSLPSMPEWFKFGVPAELAINVLVFALGLIQMFTIYGLLTGKSWSYKLALAIPILAAVSWISVAGLYMSAPVMFGLRESINWAAIGISIFWAIIYWIYLRKPHVKQYLRQIPSPPPVPVPPPPEIAAVEVKKYCRYCGAENKTDADFCDKCGKKIG